MSWGGDDLFGDPWGEPKRPRGRWRGLSAVLLPIGIVIALLTAYAWWEVQTSQVERDDDLCPLARYGEYNRHIVFLIDRSTPLTPQEISDVIEEAEIVFSKLGENERFSVYEVNPSVSSNPEILATMCSPIDQREPLWRQISAVLFGNRTADEQQYQSVSEEFKLRVEEKISKPTDEANTALLNDLARLTSLRVFRRYAEKELYIYSDMVENSEALSQIRGPVEPYADFIERVDRRKFRVPRMDGVTVHVFYREVFPVQGSDHQLFWRDYFEEAGAEVTFDPEY